MVNRTIYQNMRSDNSCCRKTLLTITIWMTFQRHDLSIAIHFRLNPSHASLTIKQPFTLHIYSTLFLIFHAKLLLTAPTKVKTSVSSNRWAGLFIIDNRKPFQKPPLTLEGQVSLLKDRGFLIDDDDAAIRLLSNVNYYHLEG